MTTFPKFPIASTPSPFFPGTMSRRDEAEPLLSQRPLKELSCACEKTLSWLKGAAPLPQNTHSSSSLARAAGSFHNRSYGPLVLELQQGGEEGRNSTAFRVRRSALNSSSMFYSACDFAKSLHFCHFQCFICKVLWWLQQGCHVESNMCKDFTSCKAQYKNLIFMIIWEKRAF
jgi:hypothetical protein